jgi:hypothetical protein
MTLQDLIVAYCEDEGIVNLNDIRFAPPIELNLICIRDDNYNGSISSVMDVTPHSMQLSISGEW